MFMKIFVCRNDSPNSRSSRALALSDKLYRFVKEGLREDVNESVEVIASECDEAADSIYASKIVDIDHGDDISLRSVHRQVFGKEPEFTNYTTSFVGTLDYIFFSSSTTAAEAVFVYPKALDDALDSAREIGEASVDVRENEDLAIMETRAQEAKPPYPNDAWPSDHLLIKATLLLSCES